MRTDKKRREDKRITNGAWTSLFVKNMDIIIAASLEREDLPEESQPLGNWLQFFKLITPNQYRVVQAKFNETLKYRLLKKLKQGQIIIKGEEEIFDDYQYCIIKHKYELHRALNRMRKIGIIDIIEEYEGVYEAVELDIDKELESVPISQQAYKEGVLIAENEGRKTLANVRDNLTASSYKKLCADKKRLQIEYNVDEFTINRYEFSNKVKSYKKAWGNYLKSYIISNNSEINYRLKYFYTKYKIIKRGSDDKLVKYLETYNPELLEAFTTLELSERLEFLDDNMNKYVSNHSQEIVKKAEAKELNFLNGKNKNVELSMELEDCCELGILTLNQVTEQLSRTREDYLDLPNSKYYDLFFNRLYAKKMAEIENYFQTAII